MTIGHAPMKVGTSEGTVVGAPGFGWARRSHAPGRLLGHASIMVAGPIDSLSEAQANGTDQPEAYEIPSRLAAGHRRGGWKAIWIYG